MLMLTLRDVARPVVVTPQLLHRLLCHRLSAASTSAMWRCSFRWSRSPPRHDDCTSRSTRARRTATCPRTAVARSGCRAAATRPMSSVASSTCSVSPPPRYVSCHPLARHRPFSHPCPPITLMRSPSRTCTHARTRTHTHSHIPLPLARASCCPSHRPCRTPRCAHRATTPWGFPVAHSRRPPQPRLLSQASHTVCSSRCLLVSLLVPHDSDPADYHDPSSTHS
jgi:hypothetical protein